MNDQRNMNNEAKVRFELSAQLMNDVIMDAK